VERGTAKQNLTHSLSTAMHVAHEALTDPANPAKTAPAAKKEAGAIGGRGGAFRNAARGGQAGVGGGGVEKEPEEKSFCTSGGEKGCCTSGGEEEEERMHRQVAEWRQTCE